MPSRTSFLKNLALSVVSTAAFFVALEFVLRQLGLPKPETRQPGMLRRDGRMSSNRHGAGPSVKWQEMKPWMSPDAEVAWRYRPNQLVSDGNPMSGVSWTYRTNSMGCRGPEPRDPQGHPFILCMGDSVAAGYGVDDGGTYEEVLESLLRSRYPGAEVSNGGVEGHSSEQGRANLRKMLSRFDPDLVTIGYGINDCWRAALPDPPLSGDGSLVREVQRLLGTSRTYRLLRIPLVHWKIRRAAHEGLATARVPPERYAENLRAMVDMVRAEGAIPIFLTPTSKWEWGVKDPDRRFDATFIEYPMALYRQTMAAVAIEKGVPRLEIPALSGYLPESEYFFVDWCHPGADGLCMIASELVPMVSRALEKKSTPRP